MGSFEVKSYILQVDFLEILKKKSRTRNENFDKFFDPKELKNYGVPFHLSPPPMSILHQLYLKI